MKIGVFDSGLGGINVLKELIEKYPNQNYLYFGDTRFLPYGEKSREELLQISARIIRFFEQERVDVIIIACGTCSGLLEEYKKMTSIPIYDVITPTVQFIKNRYSRVALLATKSTIQNKTFEMLLQKNNVSVIPLACPNFVPYIEGMTKELHIEQELSFFNDKEIQAVILGCTHYPCLKEEISEYLLVPTIDMGQCLSQFVHFKDSTFDLTIYVSHITPDIEKKISLMLNQTVEVKEQPL